jgi:Rieske Fe-S protein
METVDRSRRRLFAAVAATAASLLLLGRWLTPRKKPVVRTVLLTVPKADVPEGGALVYRETRVAVVREGGSFHALSLVCTHLGCTVSVGPDAIVCPCHGSVFDRAGNVLKGPASKPLARHPVESRGDTLVVLA